MSTESRRKKLSKTGLDFVIELPFNKSVANMEPSTFIENILHEKFGITHIIIGQDFKFGKARSGNADMLKKLGKAFGTFVNRAGGREVAISGDIRLTTPTLIEQFNYVP